MRKSLEELINRMYDVKSHLAVSKYELYDYDDGAFADIYVSSINEPKVLCSIIGHLDYRIISDEDKIRIRVFEDFKEYEY